MADSNLDWGQDLARLGRFMDETKLASILLYYQGGLTRADSTSQRAFCHPHTLTLGGLRSGLTSSPALLTHRASTRSGIANPSAGSASRSCFFGCHRRKSSTWLGFRTDGYFRKIALSGRASQIIRETGSGWRSELGTRRPLSYLVTGGMSGCGVFPPSLIEALPFDEGHRKKRRALSALERQPEQRPVALARPAKIGLVYSTVGGP